MNIMDWQWSLKGKTVQECTVFTRQNQPVTYKGNFKHFKDIPFCPILFYAMLFYAMLSYDFLFNSTLSNFNYYYLFSDVLDSCTLLRPRLDRFFDAVEQIQSPTCILFQGPSPGDFWSAIINVIEILQNIGCIKMVSAAQFKFSMGLRRL